MRAAFIPSILLLLGATSGACADRVAQDVTPPSGPVLIEGIAVDLRGVHADMLPEIREVLEREIRLSGDTSASPPLADDLAYFVRHRYLHKGYADVVTDWRVERNTVVILVTEGPRLTVGAIQFPGIVAVPEDEMEAYLVRQTREREGRAVKTLPFVPADIESGTGLVERRLEAEGYLDASASIPVFERDPVSGSVAITVNLQPGNRYAFGAVAISGSTEPLTETVERMAAELTGEPFSEIVLKTKENEIKGAWQQRGWFQAGVRAEAYPARYPGGDVPVRITVDPGNRFRVAGVQTGTNLSKGAQRVASSILGAASGSIYSPDQLDLLHRRTLDTGVFARLDVEPELAGPDTLVLKVDGEEAEPRTLGFYGGYETYLGVIAGAEARHSNIFDSGNALGMRAEATGRGYSGSIQFTNPALFASRNALTLDLSAQNFSWRDAYERHTLGLRATLTRRITRRVTAEVFAGVSTSELETSVLTREESGPGEYESLSGGARLTFDFRDSPLVPEKGWLVTAAVEGGRIEGDSSVTFVRPDFSAAWYYPLTKRLRFATGVRMAGIETDSPLSDIPIDSRLFNGGATTVRSFPERELGPLSPESVPLGGTSMHVVSAELSWELLPDFEVAVFGDAGSVGTGSGDLFSTPDDWRYAAGAGLRYKLPVGPLRLDYGFNPDRRSGEPSGAFHLTFGFAF